MDPINKLNRLLETIRLEKTSSGSIKTKQSSRPSSADGLHVNSGNTESSCKKPNTEQLRHTIRERINALNPEDRQSEKAVQIFINSVIAWKFGDELLQSEIFSIFTEKVRKAITANENLSHEFHLYLQTLAQSNSESLNR